MVLLLGERKVVVRVHLAELVGGVLRCRHLAVRRRLL